jgi:hypothetical protein
MRSFLPIQFYTHLLSVGNTLHGTKNHLSAINQIAVEKTEVSVQSTISRGIANVFII